MLLFLHPAPHVPVYFSQSTLEQLDQPTSPGGAFSVVIHTRSATGGDASCDGVLATSFLVASNPTATWTVLGTSSCSGYLYTLRMTAPTTAATYTVNVWWTCEVLQEDS